MKCEPRFFSIDPEAAPREDCLYPYFGHRASSAMGGAGFFVLALAHHRMADLLNMSLDQISSRGGRSSNGGGAGGRGSWQGGPRGRDGGGMRSEVQVSRPQSSVVVGGGGTFRSAIASTTRAPSSGSGPMRRQGVARGARESAAPYQRPTRGSESVFDRLGEQQNIEQATLLYRLDGQIF